MCLASSFMRSILIFSNYIPRGNVMVVGETKSLVLRYSLHILGNTTLLTLIRYKSHRLSIQKRLKSFPNDLSMMYKVILAIVTNKSISLFLGEPTYPSSTNLYLRSALFYFRFN